MADYMLEIVEGPEAGRQIRLGSPVELGRSPSAGVALLQDDLVSGVHARLTPEADGVRVEDLDSTNGTFVDGDRVKGEAPLAPGASVRFGDVSTVFEPTDDSAAVEKGASTRMIEVMTMSPQPPKPPPAAAPPPPPPRKPAPAPAKASAAAPRPAPPPPAPTKPKPGPRPPVAQQPKKGKGCGGSAAVLVLGLIGLVFWVFI